MAFTSSLLTVAATLTYNKCVALVSDKDNECVELVFDLIGACAYLKYLKCRAASRYGFIKRTIDNVLKKE
jgi:hypothetical protein